MRQIGTRGNLKAGEPICFSPLFSVSSVLKLLKFLTLLARRKIRSLSLRCNNILEAIGHTPLVRLNRLTAGFAADVYVKVDYMNPGGSVKDRIGISMIDDAERKGLLKPGGTIIEGTSGNTGIGLALVGAVRGYKLVFTITDKQSKEKVDLLKALGAEVIVCPTAVEPDDPRSYYSVAKKLAKDIPNSFYPNQYENPDESRGALPHHRPGNLGRLGRKDHAFRLRHGHRRHHQRRGPLPERKKSQRSNHRRRSDRIAVLRIQEDGKNRQGKNVRRRRHRRGHFSEPRWISKRSMTSFR